MSTPIRTKRFVIKRDGTKQEVRNDAIVERLAKLCEGLNADFVDPTAIGAKVSASIRSGMKTSELDLIAAEMCAYNACTHPDFSILAGRICISDLHKTTDSSFSKTMHRLFSYRHPKTKEHSPKLDADFYDLTQTYGAELDGMIDYERDYMYDYFGIHTLLRSYLMKIDGETAERPQHLLMRVALWIYRDDLAMVRKAYDLMSNHYFTHATPTLFNAGTPNPQASSCFLVHMKHDSIDGIYTTLKTCALISKYAGGIGLSIHNIRATNSYIRGTQGISNGIVPMLRVFNDTARYVDQGGGKRKGSFGIYLEPWHADIFDLLVLKKQFGKEEQRARDLFYAMWTPDLFMQKVEADEEWCLFCPNECPGLSDSWGEEFETLYNLYESEGRYRRKVSAVELFHFIVDMQIETGSPYLLFKDACNSKSNHRHLGTIKSSNLCTEIIEFTAPDEVAVCNLASIALNKFVRPDKTYDYEGLMDLVALVTRNLDNVIDFNYYPVPEAETSNMRHRPVGIGVQGFANALIMMGMPFDSEEAAAWNREVFEAMYFAGLRASVQLAKERGAYPTFPGSPASQGIFQFEDWGLKVENLSGRHDWEGLRKDMVAHGLRQSLLFALMPTASTAQIMGNNEAFEPFTSHLYKRRVLAGEFPVINSLLIKELCNRGLWNKTIKQKLMAYEGSVAHIEEIPQDIKDLYKTVWEIKQRVVIDMAADRGPFIDQSQSMNIHLSNPTREQVSSMHFYSWKRGLKTGMYYLRTRGSKGTHKFTVDTKILEEAEARHISTYAEEKEDSKGGMRCDDEVCLSCGS